MARREVRRALSEEAADETRGSAASSCDERFILAELYMDDGRRPGWSHAMASELPMFDDHQAAGISEDRVRV